MKRRVQKYRCPKCFDVNPLMALINTTTCLNCRKCSVKPVPNEFVVINEDANEGFSLKE